MASVGCREWVGLRGGRIDCSSLRREASIQGVAGLVPKPSATASAERRCKKGDDDDQGDDSGAGDEQSAIHG
jgi:hypothetical protein